MKKQNFEREIPAGYRQVYHINAKSVKMGVILNLIAVAVLAVVLVIAAIPLALAEDVSFAVDLFTYMVGLVAFLVSMLLYVVLHELVHGIAYKGLTGEKLTFGMSWSCAFCGVPHIYTYRKTALVAVLAPSVVFTVILIPVTVALYFVHPLAYLAGAILLGLHLGGCSGDAYVAILLLTKYTSPALLMRDTGPEQFFYLPEGVSDYEYQN